VNVICGRWRQTSASKHLSVQYLVELEQNAVKAEDGKRTRPCSIKQ
jgi:hypothetical protein